MAITLKPERTQKGMEDSLASFQVLLREEPSREVKVQLLFSVQITQAQPKLPGSGGFKPTLGIRSFALSEIFSGVGGLD